MKDYIDILKGGDLRSIGKSNDVVSMVNNQKDFDRLFQGLNHSDRKVVMRTADAIEKITTDRAYFLKKHKPEILMLCHVAADKELKWHLALLVSRMELNKKECETIWKILTEWATDRKESKIVRVNSIQGLYDLLPQCHGSKEIYYSTLSEIENEKIPSINARIRKIRCALDNKR